MAAFAILFSYLWLIVVAQDEAGVAECGFNGSKDVSSLVQLKVGTSVLPTYNGFVLGEESTNCDSTCGGTPGTCNKNKMAQATETDLNRLLAQLPPLGTLSCGSTRTDDWDEAPSIDLVRFDPPRCYFNNDASTIECGSTYPPERRVCACANVGSVSGDPHIHSLRGADYTLMQEGIFVAWNFSKAVPAVPGAAPAARAELQLLAAYGGDRFATQGLILLDRRSGKSMEITTRDCAWQVKEKSSWRKAQLELLSAEDGTTSFQVKKLHEKLGQSKMLRSAILLQMKSISDMKAIAQLVVHCLPQNHMGFKVAMRQKEDIEYVGGELGVAPDASQNYHFLFSKQGMLQMREDKDFQAPGSWATLGGSPDGAAYLEKKHHRGTSLLQTQACSDVKQEEAKAICSKHLQETIHPEMFAECVFDLCHGGDESFAQSAAAFFLPLDDSGA